jgi:hypothetical protein
MKNMEFWNLWHGLAILGNFIFFLRTTEKWASNNFNLCFRDRLADSDGSGTAARRFGNEKAPSVKIHLEATSSE